MTNEEKIAAATQMIYLNGGIDGAHHKDWVLDQTLRILAGDNYDQLVIDAKAGEDGADTYEYSTGIAP